ncbi:MAG: MarR family transcriptional regulator [Flaviflexus sp.]|nr:MarR family transcriptional regulator [Flaviflexus sp.]
MRPVEGSELALSMAQRRILTCLREKGDWCSVTDIAEALDLHANSVRATINVLISRGYVERVQRHTGQRGRPAWRYRAFSATGENLQLRAIVGALDQVAAESSSDIAQQLADAVDISPLEEETHTGQVARVLEFLRAAGFAVDPQDDHLVITYCPYRDIGEAPPSAICRIHAAILTKLVGDPRKLKFLPIVQPGQCQVHLPRTRG